MGKNHDGAMQKGYVVGYYQSDMQFLYNESVPAK
jgi:hypothetical protein